MRDRRGDSPRSRMGMERGRAFFNSRVSAGVGNDDRETGDMACFQKGNESPCGEI